ncbi:family 13 glycoside hydrolase [Cryphonectria parasitica EP155]|uniref:Family 13 glycoside hydrolase n=1 Tax=Cryphonectria parasitica (strain ATCC 38755 / EP155) TaxID=660469 RepID=A0A9P4YC06_CRYP1|nr:family 13 glycoside hydrolase [Cryphonectria parasitica EP155]KAF3770275.1 family 13 glycoside hydrolase [Cryphonectria parasitica EP155]
MSDTEESLSLSSPSSSRSSSPSPNETVLQGFEWHVPADNQHWRRLERVIPTLAQLGVSSLWIPPACKGFGPDSVGYDIYDLYDLGEFEQKGCVATKYGTKQELASLAHAAEAHGVGVVFDVVISHKAGADEFEDVRAVRVENFDRNAEIGEYEAIQAWTKFEYKARNKQYSSFTWHKDHFSGVDYDERTKTAGVVHRFEGKQWAVDVDSERGNYDYLMFANIDLAHPEVRRELFHWAEWLQGQLPIRGLRLDAIKHMSTAFVKDFVKHAKKVWGQECLLMGEYWVQESDFLAKYAEDMDCDVQLYDIRLVHNFRDLSWDPSPDLRTVFDGTLAKIRPDLSVTFVVNHDTQEGQTSETLVAPWFIPLAYSLILLHIKGGLPVVFYGDLYGSFGPLDERPAGTYEPADHGRRLIPKMMLARQSYAYGPQSEYLDEPDCIGFTRHGDASHSGQAGLAVLMTCRDEMAVKRMFVGMHHAGEQWTDLLGEVQGSVEIDSDGWAVFAAAPRRVSVWVDVRAVGRAEIDSFTFTVKALVRRSIACL